MSKPTDPLRRPVTFKEVWPALLGVVLLLTGFGLAKSGYTLAGYLIAAPVMIFVAVAVFRLPKEQTERIAEAIKERDKKPFWQLVNILQLAAVLLIIASAIAWLYDRI